MAYNLTDAPHFGRAGGPTVQHVRENLSLSASISSIPDALPTGAAQLWLPSPGAGYQFLIWGIQAGTAGSNLFGFKLQNTDGVDLTLAMCSKQGPFFQSFAQPIAVGIDKGLSMYPYATPTGTNLACVHITKVKVS
mgnify:FL=1|tara:strand:+ start:1334 stop:1741 length:408 start_codon:yes stop_codon:yes gene_type:complete